MWSEWTPADIVSEQELLNRAILQKCWIAYTSHGTAHFNELVITPEVAEAVLREAGIDPTTYREEMGRQVR